MAKDFYGSRSVLTPRMCSLWDAMTTGNEPETGTKPLCEKGYAKIAARPKGLYHAFVSDVHCTSTYA